MVIKSGRGVVYLTRPQKSFLPSQPPNKPRIHDLHPDLSAHAHQNGRQLPQYGYIQRLLTPKVPYLTERCRFDCTGGKGKPSNKLGGAFLTIRGHAAQGKAMN